MMVSTSNYLNPEAEKSTGQKINSFKINFNTMAHVVGCNDPVTQCQHCKGILIDEVLLVKLRTKKVQSIKTRKDILNGSVGFARSKTLAKNFTMSKTIINLRSKRNVYAVLYSQDQDHPSNYSVPYR